MLSHSGESYEYVSGQGHTAYVSGLAATSDGQHIFSAGYDDRVREVDPQGFQFVYVLFPQDFLFY